MAAARFTMPEPCLRGEYATPSSSYRTLAVLISRRFTRICLSVSEAPGIRVFTYSRAAAATPAKYGEAMEVPLM